MLDLQLRAFAIRQPLGSGYDHVYKGCICWEIVVKMSNSETAEFKLVHINIYVNFVNIYLGDFFPDSLGLKEAPLWKHQESVFTIIWSHRTS